ncbi:hypothetical protein MFFC18_47490 [Mariniblastus fucicola]|uniref:Uncharacterized protein n=2 Tax=Mariniblastus fucicola TaxID=980251 RepID=A0A5B9PJH4_9BACT|nr:hypothetical protein MFFC18_47490 [Mariniblastus fucicola]
MRLIDEGQQFTERELIDLRNLVFPRIRPCLTLSYEPAKSTPDVGASYLWGHPDLLENQEWPKIAECSDWFSAKDQLPQDQHCAFLGQFRFSDLSETLLGRELPSSGGFSIFAITETDSLGIQETVVRPWSPEQQLVRFEPPEDLITDRLGDSCNSPKRPHTITLTEAISIPDAASPTFGALIPECKWSEKFGDLYSSMMAECNEDTLGIGGYLRGTSGDDPSPDTNHMRFVVLRVTPEAGIVHFAIPNEDIEKGCLNRVQYVWSDWDS